MSTAFEARFGGQCASCGERIHVGDRCWYVDDELVHVDCSEAIPADPILDVCQECWTAKAANGECSCP